MIKIIKNIWHFFTERIPEGTKNLIIWFPIIWSDRNWDQVYIYIIFRHKLDQMQKFIRKYGHHIEADKDADNMKVCVNLLDRLINDVYYKQAFEKYDEKWGEIIFTSKDTDKPYLKGLVISHENIHTEKDHKEERQDFKRAWEHHDALKKQDLDLLFKMMRKHIETWWD